MILRQVRYYDHLIFVPNICFLYNLVPLLRPTRYNDHYNDCFTNFQKLFVIAFVTFICSIHLVWIAFVILFLVFLFSSGSNSDTLKSTPAPVPEPTGKPVEQSQSTAKAVPQTSVKPVDQSQSTAGVVPHTTVKPVEQSQLVTEDVNINTSQGKISWL